MRFTLAICFIFIGMNLFAAEKTNKIKSSDYKKTSTYSVKNEKTKNEKKNIENEKKFSWNNDDVIYKRDKYDQSPLTDYEWAMMVEKILTIEGKIPNDYNKEYKTLSRK